jgi:hypothetical protein
VFGALLGHRELIAATGADDAGARRNFPLPSEHRRRAGTANGELDVYRHPGRYQVARMSPDVGGVTMPIVSSGDTGKIRDYRDALAATERTIRTRGSVFRCQALIVAPLTVFSIAAALVTRNAVFLLLLPALVPLCGLFLLVDARVVAHWRDRLLVAWEERIIDVSAFVDTIHAHPLMPKGTVDGMLRVLPSVGELAEERRLAPATRKAIAAHYASRQRREAEHLVWKVCVSAAVVLAMLGLTLGNRDGIIVGLLVPAVCVLFSTTAARRHQAMSDRTVASCRTQPDFNEADYQRVLGQSG